jgi:ABC-type glycerol-3-phosphate transport system substrate-binding protein
MKRLAGLLMIIVLFSCSPDKAYKRDMFRIGIPARDMRLFKGRDISPIAGFNMIVLKPEEKARNLEVLLFSTHSGAFDCVVVPASTAPILGKWADPFPASWGSEIKDEIMKPFHNGNGIYALPITLDFPVFIYREDIFRDNSMPRPQNLGLLRESLKKLPGKKGAGLVSTLPEELIYLSLLSSEEGEIPVRFYSPGALRLLNFFYEFDLRQATGLEAEAAIQKNEAVAAFVRLSEAGKILRESRDKGIFLKIAPLPCTSKSYSVFDGLCLMGYGFSRKNLKALHSFIDEPFQSDLASMGYAPVIKKDYQLGPLQDAVSATNVISNPFGWEECAVLREALLDVLEGGQDPDSALMRSEARLNNMKEK